MKQPKYDMGQRVYDAFHERYGTISEIHIYKEHIEYGFDEYVMRSETDEMDIYPSKEEYINFTNSNQERIF